MEIYNTLYTALKTKLEAIPALKSIDWYNAQYQNTEKEFAEPYPAVYIEFIDPVNFNTGGEKWQHATLRFRAHVVVHDLTTSPLGTLQIAQLVTQMLHGVDLYRTIDNPDPTEEQITTKLVRVSGTMPKRFKNLKVSLVDFNCEALDSSLMDDVGLAPITNFTIN